LPPNHVHSPVAGLNSHRSSSRLIEDSVAQPHPPKSHRFPWRSIQLSRLSRLPGLLPEAGVFSVPYTPGQPQ
jgi:hypothetical protein